MKCETAREFGDFIQKVLDPDADLTDAERIYWGALRVQKNVVNTIIIADTHNKQFKLQIKPV